MFPFQAFIDGKDIDARLKLGFITAKDAVAERKARRRVRKAFENAFGKNILDGCTKFLEKSEAIIVLRNLEDLWGETKPQNIPATTSEHANWRRRLRYSMSACALDEILTITDGWRDRVENSQTDRPSAKGRLPFHLATTSMVCCSV